MVLLGERDDGSLSNLSQAPFAHATRLIKYRYSIQNFTLHRRARIETCLSSLTFAQFLIFISIGKIFADFPRCAKDFPIPVDAR